MSVKVYKTYDDSNIPALFVEDSGASVDFPIEFTNKTLVWLTGNYPFFDGTATVFTEYNMHAASLMAAGWSNVISLQSYTRTRPRIFYMNTDHTIYISCYLSSSTLNVTGYNTITGVRTSLVSVPYEGGTLTYGTTVSQKNSSIPINAAYTNATTTNASGYFTNGTGATANEVKAFWDKCDVLTPSTPVSIPVQWNSTKYGKLYQDSCEINVSQ